MPHEIYKAIEDLPPLQHEHVLEQYNGLHVDWTAELFSASKHWRIDSLVRLALIYRPESLHSVLIYCEVERDSHKDLTVAKRGTPIRVVGEIESVDSNGISLLDAKVSILPSAQPRARKRGSTTRMPAKKSKRRRRSR